MQAIHRLSQRIQSLRHAFLRTRLSAAAEKILSGRADVVVAAGAETFSDVPIRFQRSMRKRLLKADKVKKKGAGAILGAFKGMSLADLAPEAPAIKNFITGEIMGHSSDRLAAKFGVSRQEMDEYAMMSHHKAAAAAKDGRQAAEVMMFKGNRTDNGVRGDSTLNDYEKMRAAFVRPHGTHTAANSSFLTDGAAATMLKRGEGEL